MKSTPSERITIDALTEELEKYQKEEKQNVISDTSFLNEFPAHLFVSLEPLDGKNGKVYKAFDKKDNRFVALKTI